MKKAPNIDRIPENSINQKLYKLHIENLHKLVSRSQLQSAFEEKLNIKVYVRFFKISNRKYFNEFYDLL
jgi:hypothetical protein